MDTIDYQKPDLDNKVFWTKSKMLLLVMLIVAAIVVIAFQLRPDPFYVLQRVHGNDLFPEMTRISRLLREEKLDSTTPKLLSEIPHLPVESELLEHMVITNDSANNRVFLLTFKLRGAMFVTVLYGDDDFVNDRSAVRDLAYARSKFGNSVKLAEDNPVVYYFR